MSEHDMSQQDIQRALRTLADVMSDREHESLPDRERRQAEMRANRDAEERRRAEVRARGRGGELHVRRLAANGEREHEHEHEHDSEREDSGDVAPRPMGYFSERPARSATQTRAANSGDGPMVPRAVLLAPPSKREVRK